MNNARKILFRRQLRKLSRKHPEVKKVLSDSDKFDLAFEGVLMDYQIVLGSFVDSLKDFLTYLIENQEGIINLITQIIQLFETESDA